MSERFYCPDPPRDGRYRLCPDEARHLSRVCRLGPGDRVELFDGAGFATAAEVVQAASDRVELVAIGEPIVRPVPVYSIALATAVPKGDRFDWIVEKATELGVDRLIPVVFERSVVVPRGSKLDRLRRTVVEASKQSGRSRLMEIFEPIDWPDLACGYADHVRLLADPKGRPFARWDGSGAGGRIVLAVGPEGGLTEAEALMAAEIGWFPIRLGYNVLRVETAGLAGCAALIGRMAGAETEA